MEKYGSVSNWIIKASVKNWNTNTITGWVFLLGGDKSSQRKDIEKAKRIWSSLKNT